jgi:putative methanogenesis marker protein 8
MDMRRVLDRVEKDKAVYGDLHVLRFYSSFVTVSGGKVVRVVGPYLKFCPLARSLYCEIRELKDPPLSAVKKAIKSVVEKKISEFGFFTEGRELSAREIAIPYGASEIMMRAMAKNIIDAAVIVCDGAGTVIALKPGIVQGIGARMNGIFHTSPIGRIQKKLKVEGCEIPFPDAAIDQVKGVERAAELGYKKIAVTVNALMNQGSHKLREIEKKHNVTVTSLAICATGVSARKLREIEQYADLIWSCASRQVRAVTGKKALLQLSRKIPVFVLTQKGLDLISGYSSDRSLIKSLDPTKQYIIDSKRTGKRLKMGNFEAYLREAKLPVRAEAEPRVA